MKKSEINYRGGVPYTSLLEQARELRKSQTSAETLVWELLRNRKFYGLKFRRQHQIGYYIVDFYCDTHKLIIELDGVIHSKNENQLYDKERDDVLKSLGYRVVRFSNKSVLENLENFLKTLA
jgi:type I restriction enzyme, R subunit